MLAHDPALVIGRRHAVVLLQLPCTLRCPTIALDFLAMRGAIATLARAKRLRIGDPPSAVGGKDRLPKRWILGVPLALVIALAFAAVGSHRMSSKNRGRARAAARAKARARGAAAAVRV